MKIIKKIIILNIFYFLTTFIFTILNNSFINILKNSIREIDSNIVLSDFFNISIFITNLFKEVLIVIFEFFNSNPISCSLIMFIILNLGFLFNNRKKIKIL